MIDLHLTIKTHLEAQDGLDGVTIYAGRNEPPVGYNPADGAAICFRIRGGQTAYDDSHYEPSVQFKCYGTDEITANSLHRTLHTAIQNSGGPAVRWVREEGLGNLLNEPSTGWFFVLCFFDFFILEV